MQFEQTQPSLPHAEEATDLISCTLRRASSRFVHPATIIVETGHSLPTEIVQPISVDPFGSMISFGQTSTSVSMMLVILSSRHLSRDLGSEKLQRAMKMLVHGRAASASSPASA